MAKKAIEKLKNEPSNKRVSSWLPKATREKYKIVGLAEGSSSRMVYAHFGEVDFRTLSLARAKQLVDAGFPNLKEVEKVEAKADAKK